MSPEQKGDAMQLKTSVVIRALNEAEHLPALLDGLDAQGLIPDEVILVDSGSTDDTVRIAEARGAQILHIAPEDFTFGRALNIGCAAATGDILVFVSAHVYPTDRFWLQNLVAPFQSPATVLSYGRQRGDSRTSFSETQVMQRWFPDVSDENQRTPFCSNANCAVRRSWWEELPYDESLTGLEDLDWAYRASARGGRIAYRADATIIHVHEERWHQTRNRYRREAIALNRILPDQRIGAAQAARLFLLSTLRDYASAVRRGRIIRDVARIPTFRAAQFLGAWEGGRQRGDVSIELKRRFYYPKGFSAGGAKSSDSAVRP